MSEQWGWLTLIARSIDNTDFNGADFGWFSQTGSINGSTRPYSLWDIIQDIPFNKIYLGVHNGGNSFSWGVTELTVTDTDLFDGTYTNTAKEVDSCTWSPITILYDHDSNPGTARVPVYLSSSCLAFAYWGKFGSTESYFLSNNPAATSDGLNPRRYGATFPYEGLIYVK